jgi:hypothetical protein
MPSNAFFDFFDIPELEVPESLLVVEFELISLLCSWLGDLLLPRTNDLMRSRKIQAPAATAESAPCSTSHWALPNGLLRCQEERGEKRTTETRERSEGGAYQ